MFVLIFFFYFFFSFSICFVFFSFIFIDIFSCKLTLTYRAYKSFFLFQFFNLYLVLFGVFLLLCVGVINVFYKQLRIEIIRFSSIFYLFILVLWEISLLSSVNVNVNAVVNYNYNVHICTIYIKVCIYIYIYI